MDIEWNQPIGTVGIEEREPVQIGVVASDVQFERTKIFSKTIRLKNSELLNANTVKVTHMSAANIMQGKEKSVVLKSFQQTFPIYNYIVVWTRDTYELFKRDMKECHISMRKHKVIILQDIIGLITGKEGGKIRFTHALTGAGIEYVPNYLHYSKHDAHYLFQLFSKCYQEYSTLTADEVCNINVATGKIHLSDCRYIKSSLQNRVLIKPQSMIFNGYTVCKVCASKIEWNRLKWKIPEKTYSVKKTNLRNLPLTDKNIETICNYFHMKYNISNNVIFISTSFASWIVYLKDERVDKLFHENYKPGRQDFFKKKKKCLEGYHKQKLPSHNFFEVVRYIESHDAGMTKRLIKRNRIEKLFELVEQQSSVMRMR